MSKSAITDLLIKIDLPSVDCLRDKLSKSSGKLLRHQHKVVIKAYEEALSNLEALESVREANVKELVRADSVIGGLKDQLEDTCQENIDFENDAFLLAKEGRVKDQDILRLRNEIEDMKTEPKGRLEQSNADLRKIATSLKKECDKVASAKLEAEAEVRGLQMDRAKLEVIIKERASSEACLEQEITRLKMDLLGNMHPRVSGCEYQFGLAATDLLDNMEFKGLTAKLEQANWKYSDSMTDDPENGFNIRDKLNVVYALALHEVGFMAERGDRWRDKFKALKKDTKGLAGERDTANTKAAKKEIRIKELIAHIVKLSSGSLLDPTLPTIVEFGEIVRGMVGEVVCTRNNVSHIVGSVYEDYATVLANIEGSRWQNAHD